MTRMAILSKWEHPCKMANIITGIRIVCSIALLFCPLFSQAFYALYITAGISDMIDGTIARKTGTVSELGAKLDTAADFVLVVVCLIRMIPALHIPMWLVIWIIVIAAIRAINLVYGYVMRKKLVALHTVMNKVTGISLSEDQYERKADHSTGLGTPAPVQETGADTRPARWRIRRCGLWC